MEKKVRDAENKIKDNSYETAIVIHPNTGKVLVNAKGDSTSVDITPKQLMNDVPGAIVTHNHPNTRGWDEDVSFSSQDIQTAMTYQVAEMRAVSPKSRYVLKPPDSGWNVDFYRKKWVNTEVKMYKKTLKDAHKKYNRGEFKSHAEMETWFHDAWMGRTAEATGVKYSRTPIKQKSRRKVAA